MATILDAFLVTFGLDSSGMEEGAEKGKGALEDLKSTALKVLGVVGGAFAMKEMIGNFAAGADAAMKLADALGEDMEMMQAMGRAAALEGGSVEAFNASIKGLNASLVQVATTGEGRAKKYLDELGISATDAQGKVKPASAVLMELADSFEGLSAQEAAGLGEKLTLDAGMINLLRKGREEVELAIQQQKELGVYTKEDALVAAEFNDQIDNMATALQMMVAPIVKLVLPALTKLAEMTMKAAMKMRDAFKAALPDIEQRLDKLSKFMEEHGEVIEYAFIAIAGIVTAIYIPAMYRAAAATIAATWPFLAIAAVIAAVSIAIGLLVEDFLVWKSNGKSAFGDVWAAVMAFYNNVKPILDALGELFGAVWDLLVATAIGAFSTIVRGWGMIFDLLKAPAEVFFTWIEKGIASILDKLGGIQGIVDFIGGAKDWAVDVTGRMLGKAPVEPRDAVSPSATAAGTNNQTSNTVDINSITVNTQATDATGIAKDLGKSIQSNGLGSLVLGADSGVRQ